MSERHKRCQKCFHSIHCQLGTHGYMQAVLDGGCDQYRPAKPPKTNGDKIRAMSNEELAAKFSVERFCPDQMADCNGRDCKQCWKHWLDKEVEI